MAWNINYQKKIEIIYFPGCLTLIFRTSVWEEISKTLFPTFYSEANITGCPPNPCSLQSLPLEMQFCSSVETPPYLPSHSDLEKIPNYKLITGHSFPMHEADYNVGIGPALEPLDIRGGSFHGVFLQCTCTVSIIMKSSTGKCLYDLRVEKKKMPKVWQL